MLRWILFLLFALGISWYAFQALRTVTQNKLVYVGYFIFTVAVYGNLIWQTTQFDRATGWTAAMGYAIGLFLMVFTFQAVVLLFLFLEDIIRMPQGLYSYFTGQKWGNSYLPERRKFISQLAIGLAALPFSSLLYGMYKGRYNYKVLRYEMAYEDLPEAFDGFTITQISDIHCGSFDNSEKVQYGIDLINAQKSDVILFTGDFVNNTTSELLPWMDLFATLKAPQGKFSVMGNHDYGDYMNWPSEAAKKENFEAFKAAHQKMGFQLLLNQAAFIEKEKQRLAIVGVENWGAGGFKKAGDLDQALAPVATADFKVLMSHDPSHWEAKVLPHPEKIHLTLSGHTHGMQFGIEIPGWFKWSPVQWRYKQWAGIYEHDQQRLNVNRGFGYLAYPGRVGMWPEISVITLKRKATAT
jgi:predicted MPP superfamily phosphohydrolase